MRRPRSRKRPPRSHSGLIGKPVPKFGSYDPVPRSQFPNQVSILELTDPSGGQWVNPPADETKPAGQMTAGWAMDPSQGPCGNPTGDATAIQYPNCAFEWYPLSTLPSTGPGGPGIYLYADEMADSDAASGYAVIPHVSGGENPFTHPFMGNHDFDFTLSLDQQFEAGPTNLAGMGNSAQYGWSNMIGVEIDSDLLPTGFEPRDGDRVAVYGRWIVDAGHPNFHTEIHPYLLLGVASARENSGGVQSRQAWTRFTLASRPYMTSQLYPKTASLGSGLITDPRYGESLLDYVHDMLYSAPKQLRLGPTVWGDPSNNAAQSTANNVVGDHVVGFLVSPPVLPAPGPDDLLMMTTQFHARAGSAVALHPVMDGTGRAVAVWVVVELHGPTTANGTAGPDELAAIQPPPLNWITVSVDQLLKDWGQELSTFKTVMAELLWGPVAFYRYDPLPGPDMFLDDLTGTGLKNIRVDSLASLGSGVPGAVGVPIGGHYGVKMDQTMPWPVYGWLDLYWSTSPVGP